LRGARLAAEIEAMNAPHPRPNPPQVQAGSVTVLRLYDVAYQADLARVEALLQAQQGRPADLRRA
jgi:hypothetical protein